MGDINEYIKQLESDNEDLRSKLFDMYSSKGKRSHIHMKSNMEGVDCHRVGISGGCGHECPVFLEGNCQSPEPTIDWLREQIECFEEIIESYEIKILLSKT